MTFSAACTGRAPRVSVALPVHNQRRYLEESVNSILSQTMADFELVIGCDGSDDGSSHLLQRLAARDPRIRLLRRETKSGLAASANWVVGETRAPFVAIAHGDDISHPERLEQQLARLEARSDAVAVGSVSVGIDPRGREVQPPDLWRLLHPSPFAPFAHSSVMFRREAFERAGRYREQCDYWEDLDLWWRLDQAGAILILPKPLVHYRHSVSSSRGRDDALTVERSLEAAYRAAETRWHGRRAGGRSVRPRVFVARAWVALWCARRPHLFRAMLRRSRLRPDAGTLLALGFLGWAAVSPRSLRAAVRAFMKGRNALARPRLEGIEVVEWTSRPPESDVPLRLLAPAAASQAG